MYNRFAIDLNRYTQSIDLKSISMAIFSIVMDGQSFSISLSYLFSSQFLRRKHGNTRQSPVLTRGTVNNTKKFH